MVCAKAIATMIPIAMPVLDVFREMDMRVFPGVREVVNRGGIIVIRRHRYLLLFIPMLHGVIRIRAKAHGQCYHLLPRASKWSRS